MKKFHLSAFIAFCLFLCFATLSHAETPDEAFDGAMALLLKGKFTESRKILEKNIAEHPDHSLSYAGLALFSVAYNTFTPEGFSKAREYLEKAKEKGPDNHWLHIVQAILHAVEYARGDIAAVESNRSEAIQQVVLRQ